MTTAADIIKAALRRINSYQSGEPLAQVDAQDCLDTFNDLLDSWSIDKMHVFGSNEWILSWTAQKMYYTVGNPTNAQLSNSTGYTETSASATSYLIYPNTGAGQVWPNISGTIANGLPYVQNVTSIPNNLISGTGLAYQTGSGSILVSLQNLIPYNTTVLSFAAGGTFTGSIVGTTLTATAISGTLGLGQILVGTGVTVGTYISAILTTPNTYTVSATQTAGPVAMTAGGAIVMSANATASSQSSDSITYTIPGDFPIPRPLRITYGFTRFNQLDFTLNVTETQSQYTRLLYKRQAGPWPTVAWYNNSFPYGILNAYQTPGNNAELHLFTDTILNNMTLNQQLSMPQGYVRALKWALAKEICAEYGFPISEAVRLNGQAALEYVKALNAQPAAVGSYDRELVRGGRPDGGWVTHGGYRG